jgi:hypothetical protein
VKLNQGAGNRESEAKSAKRPGSSIVSVFALGEGVENRFKLRPRHADA